MTNDKKTVYRVVSKAQDLNQLQYALYTHTKRRQCDQCNYSDTRECSKVMKLKAEIARIVSSIHIDKKAA